MHHTHHNRTGRRLSWKRLIDTFKRDRQAERQDALARLRSAIERRRRELGIDQREEVRR